MDCAAYINMSSLAPAVMASNSTGFAEMYRSFPELWKIESDLYKIRNLKSESDDEV
jgi:hypothetical protein